MTPQTQQIIGRNGDCLRACIASVLGLHVFQVPHFCDNVPDEDDSWFQHARSWVRANHNADLLLVGWDGWIRDWMSKTPDLFSIALGTATTGESHAVVYQGSQLIHDPHPEGRPFIGPPHGVIVFVALDPEAFRNE